jgi:hypothetical protein
VLKRLLRQANGYVIRSGRDNLVECRVTREQAARHLWPLAARYGGWLAHLPFVRMVAVTGALAVQNVTDNDDDLDYLLVTQPNRVWTARAFSIVLVRLARLRGVTICPNYVLAESALEQERKDLFIAHEIAQMIPLYGHDLYQRFRAVNAWADNHLPNATTVYYHAPKCTFSTLGHIAKAICERLLSGRLGNWLEKWEYQRKLRRFAREIDTPHSAAQIDEQRVKGHFNDYGHPVLRKYRQRLHDYGLLEETPLAAPGD